MTKFEIGKTYSMRSICDHDCVDLHRNSQNGEDNHHFGR